MFRHLQSQQEPFRYCPYTSLCIPPSRSSFCTSETHERRFWLGSPSGPHHCKTLRGRRSHTAQIFFYPRKSIIASTLMSTYHQDLQDNDAQSSLCDSMCSLSVTSTSSTSVPPSPPASPRNRKTKYYVISAGKCVSVFDDWFSVMFLAVTRDSSLY